MQSCASRRSTTTNNPAPARRRGDGHIVGDRRHLEDFPGFIGKTLYRARGRACDSPSGSITGASCLALSRWTGIGCVLVAFPCFANNAASDQLDKLKRMSFEELMDVEITSVSRTEESLRDAAAAVSVVGRDTIRRSGATSVPDALRLVPGIHVGEQTAATWAVSARGFSSVTSEKLLVMSDTRSIYTPLFSGVFWDSQDYLLEDLERIEVIRGPGATLWGTQRGQRRHQHHHAQRARHARHLCCGQRGYLRPGARRGTIRRRNRGRRQLSRIRQVPGSRRHRNDLVPLTDDAGSSGTSAFAPIGTARRMTRSPSRAMRTRAKWDNSARPSP